MPALRIHWCAALLGAACLTPQSSGRAQTPSGDTSFAAIERAAEKDMAQLRIPGMAVALVDDGRIVYTRGFGVANAETKTPVTPDMLFRVGSVSKPLAAYTILAEARARGIVLDAPIGRYMSGLSPGLARLTLAQLLSHTAGVRDVVTATPLEEHSGADALVREVRTWSDTMLFAEPGEVMSYSNPGFILAGAVISSVTGMPWERLVARRVFEPLGLGDATYDHRVAVTHPYADGHVGPRGQDPTVVRPIRTDARRLPPTFLWASAGDLARLETAFLDHGRIDGRQALDSAVIAEMAQPRASLPAPPAGSYGFGLLLRDVSGGRLMGHSGRIEGYWAEMVMNPQRRRGFVLLSNRLDIAPAATMAATLAFLGSTPAARLATPAGSWDGRDLPGHYANGRWRFEIVDSAGVLEFRGPRSPTNDRSISARIAITGRDLFTIRPTSDPPSPSAPGIPVAVVRDAAGRVRYLFTGERAARRQ